MNDLGVGRLLPGPFISTNSWCSRSGSELRNDSAAAVEVLIGYLQSQHPGVKGPAAS